MVLQQKHDKQEEGVLQREHDNLEERVLQREHKRQKEGKSGGGSVATKAQ